MHVVRTRHLLWYAALAVLIALGIWFFFFRGGVTAETIAVQRGDFVQQVSVSGTVVAARAVDLGVSAGGRVAHVYAAVGDTVSAGALIAEVENGDLRALVLQKQAALETQEAKLASLKSGTRPEEIAIAETAVANDHIVLDQANQGVVNAVQDAYAKADAAIHDDMDQFLSNPRSATPQFNFQIADTQLQNDTLAQRVAMERALSAWQLESATLYPAGDLDSAAARAKAYLSDTSAILGNTSAALSRAIPNSSIPQSAINGYITEIAAARASINTASSALNTALTTRASAASALARDEKTLALNKAGATVDDIAAQEAQVKAAIADLQSARAQLGKTIIVAPFAGTITKMDAKVGAIVSAGSSHISMISSGAFQIESYVPEVSIAHVQVGNPAEATLDAYGAGTVFIVHVVSIDPAETVRDGVSTYKTILEFTANDTRIRSGMTANVVITTQKKNNVLSVPRGVVSERDGETYVSILRGTDVVETKVETGDISSMGTIEILSGLAEGDTVVLPRP